MFIKPTNKLFFLFVLYISCYLELKQALATIIRLLSKGCIQIKVACIIFVDTDQYFLLSSRLDYRPYMNTVFDIFRVFTETNLIFNM